MERMAVLFVAGLERFFSIVFKAVGDNTDRGQNTKQKISNIEGGRAQKNNLILVPGDTRTSLFFSPYSTTSLKDNTDRGQMAKH